MGLTAPALFRYVSGDQELVDTVAFELEKAAARSMVEAAGRYPESDSGARLVAACAGFRTWALTKPGHFELVVANPIAAPDTERRDLVTVSTSGRYLTDPAL